ncbi:MAG: aminotransferase class I/II-fold pyridoxal phosphate-dependent enzyme, partial [Gammaproteobacteria bacterium]|nr:aminotransferase class I/II-fold pyridoxal phosphate-dependent enzyme [Gammaproteobacteria bacterium]
EQRDLVVLADEIYAKVIYDDAQYIPLASIPADVLTVTFNGLSKAYRAPGFRTGWMVVSGAKRRAADYMEGLDILASMRLCANVPTQHAIQTALGGTQSIEALIRPGGRLEAQRTHAHALVEAIPGVTCVKPRGALYLFPRIDAKRFNISDDERFVLDLLREEHILVIQGTGFNWPKPDHIRLVFLPRADELTDAIGRMERFLARYRQG